MIRKPTALYDKSTLSDEQIQRHWESAYTAFETEEQEIRKFLGRLKSIGEDKWPREAKVVEIFCGRGNGLVALERLGFRNLEGVDISPALLARYKGTATLIEADCRKLPQADASRDVIIVQGGLHHLPNLDDVEKTLNEVKRVLKPDGKFVMVEPWLTPFLQFVHFVSERTVARAASAKIDAFATMTHYEADTYFRWLSEADKIRDMVKSNFNPVLMKESWGKFVFVGTPRRNA